jgi:predicted GH43/DUF377 family glycosyl hydrolase
MVHNVVFSCGAVLESDGTVKIYWGDADTVMCVGEANLSGSVRTMPASRQTGKISMAFQESYIPLNGV